jgi:hypothetical protein
MDSKDVLLDLLDTYKRGIHSTVDGMSAEALTWQPDPQANHIAVTLWHLARVMDAVLAHRIHAAGAEAELWFTRGWAEKYAYDPRGKGSNSLGMLTGYSVEEMKAVPVMPLDDLLAYFDASHAALVEFVKSKENEALLELAPGSDPKRDFYFWVKICLIDGTRHTGEIQAIKAMWERKA